MIWQSWVHKQYSDGDREEHDDDHQLAISWNKRTDVLLVDLIYNMSPLVPNNITIIIDETNNMVALYLVGRRTH